MYCSNGHVARCKCTHPKSPESSGSLTHIDSGFPMLANYIKYPGNLQQTRQSTHVRQTERENNRSYFLYSYCQYFLANVAEHFECPCTPSSARTDTISLAACSELWHSYIPYGMRLISFLCAILTVLIKCIFSSI